MNRVVALLLSAVLLAACGGGSRPETPAVDPATPNTGCDGSCADTATQLSVADVEAVIAQAVAEAQARNVAATIAVVDRVGNVLGVFQMNGAASAITVASPGAAYLNGGLALLRREALSQYVTDVQTFTGLPTALTDGAIAFSDRAGGNLSRPFYPDGVVSSLHGPFSKPAGSGVHSQPDCSSISFTTRSSSMWVLC